MEQYLVDVQKGAGTIHEDRVLVTCFFKCDDSSLADEVDFVCFIIGRLDDCVVLVSLVSHRNHYSVHKSSVATLKYGLESVEEFSKQ